MSKALVPRRFTACFSELPRLLGAAREACDAAGVDSDVKHHVELVLEEAFSNSVLHGYGAESETSFVYLAAEILPDILRIVYQDVAPPFDPLTSTVVPVAGRIGGIGRVLMKALPLRTEYAREGDRNTLTLEFTRGPRMKPKADPGRATR